MKKFLLAIFALAVATTVATAAVGIDWTAGTWGYDTDATTPVLDNNSVLWQLIYAGADNMIDPIPSPVAVAPGPDTAYGDDDVWAYRTVAQTGGVAPEDGTTWDNWLQYATLDPRPLVEDLSWATAGFVYQRVFGSSTPGNETWYYESGLTALNLSYAASDPTSLTISYADTSGDGFVLGPQQVSMVPEPATMGLLGLGALVMAIRRRRS